MLTKPPIETFVPGQPARAAQPAYTSCVAQPPPGAGGSNGSWQYVCSNVLWPINSSMPIAGGQSVTAISASSTHITYRVCASQWVPNGNPPPPPSPDTVVCTTVPAVAAQPFIPSRIEYSLSYGWNAGANSVAEVEGDAYLRATMAKVVGVAWGIGPVDREDQTRDVERIAHGWLFQQDDSGNAYAVVVESGKAVTLTQSYGAETVFEIRRIDAMVQYLMDNYLIHTSRHELTGPVMAVSSLFATGDRIE